MEEKTMAKNKGQMFKVMIREKKYGINELIGSRFMVITKMEEDYRENIEANLEEIRENLKGINFEDLVEKNDVVIMKIMDEPKRWEIIGKKKENCY